MSFIFSCIAVGVGVLDLSNGDFIHAFLLIVLGLYTGVAIMKVRNTLRK